MYNYKTSKNLDRTLLKLSNKDNKLCERVLKKIQEIIDSYNIEHYKNLRKPLQHFKRIHVGAFVLVFRFDKKEKIIYFADFDHHDNIYKKRINY